MLYARGSTGEWLALNQCDGGSNPPGRTQFVGKWRSLVGALGLEPRGRELESHLPNQYRVHKFAMSTTNGQAGFVDKRRAGSSGTAGSPKPEQQGSIPCPGASC